MSAAQLIRSIPYFASATDEELAYVAERSVLRVLAAEETIFLEGERATGLWIVEQGSVKIFKLNPDGGEHILHLRGPGNTFNDIAALDGGINPANAAALSDDVTVWLIPSAIIGDVLARNPKVAADVIRLLGRRVRTLVAQIENLALYSVVVRLSRFLLRQAADPALKAPGITRTAIAAYINTTPQTVSVALRELEAAGAIEFDRHRVVIVNESMLRSIAML